MLEANRHPLPFPILGFHAGHGAEFINHSLAKLLAEFTKSRPSHSLDTPPVEGKNGAVMRKHIGYAPIPARHAGEPIDPF